MQIAWLHIVRKECHSLWGGGGALRFTLEPCSSSQASSRPCDSPRIPMLLSKLHTHPCCFYRHPCCSHHTPVLLSLHTHAVLLASPYCSPQTPLLFSLQAHAALSTQPRCSPHTPLLLTLQARVLATASALCATAFRSPSGLPSTHSHTFTCT